MARPSPTQRTMKARLLSGSVDMESTSNGLGPGFRQMFHIWCGLGKCDRILSKSYMAKVLDEVTAWMAARWPWPVHPKRRHVQSTFCEMQKLLFYCLHGHPPASSCRQPLQITAASILKLAEKYLRDHQNHQRPNARDARPFGACNSDMAAMV